MTRAQRPVEWLAGAALAVALASGGPARAEPPGAFVERPTVAARAAPPALIAHVRVRATGLRARDFSLRVLEPADGGWSVLARLPAGRVRSFRDSDEPLAIAVVVQESLLVEPGVAGAVRTIADVRPHDTRIGVWTFGDTVRPRLPFAAPAEASVQPASPGAAAVAAGAPRVGAAIATVADALGREAGRRALFLLCDAASLAAPGEDVTGRLRAADVETFVVVVAPGGLDLSAARHAGRLAVGGDVSVVSLPAQVAQAAWVLRNTMNDRYSVEFPLTPRQVGSLFTGETRPVVLVVKDDETEAVEVAFAASAAPAAPEGAGHGSSYTAALAVIGLGLVAAGALACVLVLRRPRPRPAPLEPAARGEISTGASGVTACLVPLSGPGRMIPFRIEQGRYLIGRAADCDIRLDDPYVSQHHAALIAEGGAYYVVDTGSTGGVIVTAGGARAVQRVQLDDRDTFVCGQTTLQLRLDKAG